MVFEEAKRILLWGLICSSSTVATLFGFTGIAAAAAGIAKCLYFLCLVIYLIFFVLGVSAGERVPLGNLRSWCFCIEAHEALPCVIN